jgi:hypothetical protein
LFLEFNLNNYLWIAAWNANSVKPKIWELDNFLFINNIDTAVIRA